MKTVPEVPIEDDLMDCVNRGELTEWQAITAQTCRDAAYARSLADDVKKKVQGLQSSRETQIPNPDCPVRLVRRG